MVAMGLFALLAFPPFSPPPIGGLTATMKGERLGSLKVSNVLCFHVTMAHAHISLYVGIVYLFSKHFSYCSQPSFVLLLEDKGAPWVSRFRDAETIQGVSSSPPPFTRVIRSRDTIVL